MKEILLTKRFLALIAFIVISAGITLSFTMFNHKGAEYQYFTEMVERGPLRSIVNATGNVQAVVTVQVGSQVSGQIEAIYADFNSRVKRGQLLAKIDPRTYQAQLENSKANLAAAQSHTRAAMADLATQQANLMSSKANLEAARVTKENDALILKRDTEMSSSGIIAQNDLDTARAAAEASRAKYEQAAAAVTQAEAQINSQKAQVEQAKAQEAQAKADLDHSQLNLDYCSIASPVDGVVISRSIDVGQTVAASLQAPLLFVIANDLTKMQVNASVDEADIGHISGRSDVKFTVDAYPNENFSGKIAEIRLNPQTIQNVVTYSVIINVDNEDLKLKPGMTANIVITVDTRNDVVKIPNAAVRYLPPGMTRDKEKQLMSGLKQIATDTSNKTGPESGTPPKSGVLQTAGQTSAGETESGSRPATVKGSRHSSQTADNALGIPALAPGQMWNPADKLRFPTPPKRIARPTLIWVLGPENQPEPKEALLGISDGTFTEMSAGDLKAGDRVIIADTSQEGPTTSGPRSPFVPGAGRRH